MFENTVLRIFGQIREGGEIYVIMSSVIYRPAVCTVRLGCSRSMKLEEHGVYVEEYPNVCRVLEGNRRKLAPSIMRHRWIEITEMVLNI
jgi:hypothetical protein